MPMDYDDKRMVESSVGGVQFAVQQVEAAVRTQAADLLAQTSLIELNTNQVVPWLTAIHAQQVETNRLLALLVARP